MTAPLIFRFNPVPNNRVPNNRPLPIITFLKNIQPPPSPILFEPPYY